MPRITIYRDESVDERAVKRLLEEAGCAVSEEDEPGADKSLSDNAGAKEGDEPCEPDVVVVVLTSEVCTGENLEGELKRATNAHCRIVGVWPAGTADGTTLPDSLKKYGASEVPWIASEVRKVICGGQDTHKQPSGAKRTAVNTDRNCC